MPFNFWRLANEWMVSIENCYSFFDRRVRLCKLGESGTIERSQFAIDESNFTEITIFSRVKHKLSLRVGKKKVPNEGVLYSRLKSRDAICASFVTLRKKKNQNRFIPSSAKCPYPLFLIEYVPFLTRGIWNPINQATTQNIVMTKVWVKKQS